jgi:hypothetical protein
MRSLLRRWWPRVWSGLAVISAAGTVSAGPAVKVLNPTFNFGKTLQHVTVSHDFWIKSIGDRPLVITRVVPGCGCTQAPLRDSVLAPGDSTVLTVIFSTRSYAGNITKRPYLITNVSDERVSLTIQAEVIIDPEMSAPLRITPFEIDVARPGSQEHRHAVFLIENQSDHDYEVTLVDQTDDFFEVKLPQEIRAGETAEGMVLVHRDLVKEEFEGSLTFEINDANQTRYSLPVYRLFEKPE